MARTSFRFVANPRMYDELARSSQMRDALKDAADRGADVARAIAPSYTGPTYDPAVQRHGEYRQSIYSAASMRPNGWRAEFGATAGWWGQVEFGSGRPATSRDRPQTGWSPKARPLGRALDALRSA
ncbi:HK97 gp10 family phage protein [Streptomyces sp. NPDC053086]|uniref:HK97 gp10 family phage protein n=1 Tax=unclassified Streptomyces TaxID=2593676 RepID=UPI0037D79B22